MKIQKLHIPKPLTLKNTSMVIGLSGWMDGGNVSTGTIEYLRQALQAEQVGWIDPNGFFLYYMPGAMETAAMFRPHVQIEDGIIQAYNLPEAVFHHTLENNLILFQSREPNLGWREFSDCIFEMCRLCDVQRIIFIGSVAGVVPHTREPRVSCSVSNQNVKQWLSDLGVRFSSYSGPASFANCIMKGAMSRNIDMVSIVAEIPVYLQGYNPTCIEMAVKYVSRLLGIHIGLDSLRSLSDEFERRVSDLVKQEPELAARVTQLEEIYDKEIFESEMGDLKSWLEQRGIRLD